MKTEPAHKAKPEEIHPSSNSWKVASYISFVVIVAVIVLNIIPRANNNRKVLEKSIAVLPLEYLSEDPNKEYLANGVLDAITGHLSMIEGLRVMPRTSVEQYRENKKSAKEIGEELDVSYLIEGSFLMIEDQVKLTIQLVVAADGDHVFFKEYDRDYEDIIVVQSEVAKTIAKEIEVAITPEEKVRIENVPTTSLTAYDFYQRGRDEHDQYWLGNADREALERAEEFYHRAMEYDSTFAQAYSGLAQVYFNKHFRGAYLSDNFMDSALILADKALSFDNHLDEAYIIRGYYFEQHNDREQALIEFDKAIKFNPNSWLAYYQKGYIFRWGDAVEALSNFYKAASLRPESFLPWLYEGIGFVYAGAGFYEKAIYYKTDVFKLNNDSALYYQGLFLIEDCFGNFEKAIILGEKCLSIDSTRLFTLTVLGDTHRLLKQYKELLEVYREIEYQYKLFELGRHFAQNIGPYYQLTAAYSILGEVDSALYHLEALTQIKGMPIWVTIKIKADPMFDNIRDEPQFQQMVRVLDSNYQAEHERVRQWLEENDML